MARDLIAQEHGECTSCGHDVYMSAIVTTRTGYAHRACVEARHNTLGPVVLVAVAGETATWGDLLPIFVPMVIVVAIVTVLALRAR